MPKQFALALLIVCLSVFTVAAQQTAFTYQGKLNDNGSPANGNYDLQFALFNLDTGGTQIGQTKSLSNVAVSGGVFAVKLDFGLSAFPGQARFLEISARPVGNAAYTLLTPRQEITSTPYASFAFNANDSIRLNGLPEASYAKSNDPRLFDERSPVAGSTNYIQNTTVAQPNSNFNISGNGLVGGNVGIGTGSPQTKLHVVGQDIRVESNTATMSPRFSWNFSGGALNEKKWNAYATTKSLKFTSLSDTEDTDNVWLQANRVGRIVDSVSIPVAKVGIGDLAFTPQFSLHIADINANLRVESNAFGAPTVPRFSFNMAQAQPNEKKWQNYAAPNELVFAALDDVELTEDAWLVVSRTGPNISKVTFPKGIKITDLKPTLSRPTFRAETSLQGGTLASFGDKGDITVDSLYTGPSTRFVIKETGRVGIGTANPTDTLQVFGTLRVDALGLGGSSSLCRNSSGQISGCSSSLRYKTDLHPFTQGLNLINRLHPLTFRWKADQSPDLGLGAEDVAAIEPLLVTHNANGEVEGVKYDRLNVVLINAIKEQQAQIRSQEDRIRSQNAAIAVLQNRLGSLERATRVPRRHRR